jgi:regulator of protease activity HflC (stomatin/prohibitin superfamily)
LGDILSDRESIALDMQVSPYLLPFRQYLKATLDDAIDPWGVAVEREEMKDDRVPEQLQRAMAAEATREARAKVIAAEGEHKASRALRQASEVIVDSPEALQVNITHSKHLQST